MTWRRLYILTCVSFFLCCSIRRHSVSMDVVQDSVGSYSHKSLVKAEDTMYRMQSVTVLAHRDKSDSSITKVYTFSKPASLQDIETKQALVSSVTTIQNRISEVEQHTIVSRDTTRHHRKLESIDTISKQSSTSKKETIKAKAIKKPSYLWIFWVSLSVGVLVFLGWRIMRYI